MTLKISENNYKIDDLLAVDKNIIKGVSANAIKIDTNESTINDVISAQGVINGFVSTNTSKIDNIKIDISTQIKSDIDEIKSN